MADNITLDPGAGGDNVRAEELPAASGIKIPYTKVLLGGVGADDGPVALGNPMPVTMLGGSLPLPTGAAEEATLVTLATQATLALIKAKTDNLDALLSTRASEATLAAILAGPVITEGQGRTKATYAATILGLVPGIAATDIFTIIGSGTKTIKITKITISGTQTVAGTINIALIKRSAPDSGGTSTNPVMVSHDSANAAATALVTAYTVNPTLGTVVGTMQSHKLLLPAPASLAQSSLILELEDAASKPIVLRGNLEQLAISLNGVTPTGGSLNISIEWTEE